MIKSKGDYKYYLQEDKKHLGHEKAGLKEFIFDPIWKFQRLLRKYEYITNCKRGLFWKVYKLYLKFKFRRMSIKLGFTIPINVFGYGLAIGHWGTIIVNSNARIGNYCRLHCCTNIGECKGHSPIIGDHCYIAPGAKLYGNIKIGNYVQVGANAVVNKSFDEDYINIAGVPAKIVGRPKYNHN